MIRALGLAFLVLLAAGAARADDLILTIDGKTHPQVRVRRHEKTLWIKTTWLAKHTGITVKQEAPGAPVVVCRDEVCWVGPDALLTDDGAECDLLGALRVLGAKSRELSTSGRPTTVDVTFPGDDPTFLALGQVAVGQPFPDVTLQLLNGGKVRLSEFRGRKLLIVNWASW